MATDNFLAAAREKTKSKPKYEADPAIAGAANQ
jgi:hypothetical protein